jgi:two-component system C4-dicarboxylate transport sensor histidine kinase DctB
VFRQTRDELIQAAKLAALGAWRPAQPRAQPAWLRSAPTRITAPFSSSGAQSADARTNLDRIQALTTRMAELIKHLKRFSRRSDVALATVDLRRLSTARSACFAPVGDRDDPARGDVP